jgi:streptothricin acetyltransferase
MIIEITPQNLKDINKPNQSFEIIGKIIPVFSDGVWSYSEYLYDKPAEKTYPADEEHWEEYINNPDKIIFFYYDNDDCVGQVRLRKNWNKYGYIEDIVVSKSHRKHGIGLKLIQKAIEWAKEKGFSGLMLETQDNNLLACRFYNKLGFQIGAVDTMLYANFNNADENAVFWYMKF